jgi:hypothetical protein
MRVLNEKGGTLTTYESATGNLVGTVRLAGTKTRLLQYALSHDQKFLAGTTDHRTVHVWEVVTGKQVARFMDPRGLRFGLATAYAVWCVAWVLVGTRITRKRPWLDVILIISLPLSVLFAYAATRSRWEIDPLAIAFSLGMLTALAGMLNVWWIHGGIRWSLRLTGLVGGLASIGLILMVSGHRSDGAIWNVILGTVSFVGGLSLLLMMCRWFKFAITCAPTPDAVAPPPKTHWQIPLRDILLLTAGIAFLLAVLRFASPGARPFYLLAYVSIYGTALATTVFINTWAALGTRPFLLRLGLSGPAVPILGAMPVLLLPGFRGDPLWWCEIVFAVTAATVFLSLTIFRLHGYRLVR